MHLKRTPFRTTLGHPAISTLGHAITTLEYPAILRHPGSISLGIPTSLGYGSPSFSILGRGPYRNFGTAKGKHQAKNRVIKHKQVREDPRKQIRNPYHENKKNSSLDSLMDDSLYTPGNNLYQLSQFSCPN